MIIIYLQVGHVYANADTQSRKNLNEKEDRYLSFSFSWLLT